MAGQILDKNKMYLLVFVGSAEVGSSGYGLLHTANGAPVVESAKTMQKFHLGWEDIVNMARAAGIDNDPDDVCPVCGEQGYGDDPENCSFCEDQRDMEDEKFDEEDDKPISFWEEEEE